MLTLHKNIFINIQNYGRTHFEILEEQAKLIYQEELAERERIESSDELTDEEFVHEKVSR